MRSFCTLRVGSSSAIRCSLYGRFLNEITNFVALFLIFSISAISNFFVWVPDRVNIFNESANHSFVLHNKSFLSVCMKLHLIEHSMLYALFILSNVIMKRQLWIKSNTEVFNTVIHFCLSVILIIIKVMFWVYLVLYVVCYTPLFHFVNNLLETFLIFSGCYNFVLNFRVISM